MPVHFDSSASFQEKMDMIEERKTARTQTLSVLPALKIASVGAPGKEDPFGDVVQLRRNKREGLERWEVGLSEEVAVRGDGKRMEVRRVHSNIGARVPSRLTRGMANSRPRPVDRGREATTDPSSVSPSTIRQAGEHSPSLP